MDCPGLPFSPSELPGNPLSPSVKGFVRFTGGLRMESAKERRTMVRYPVSFLGDCGVSGGVLFNLSLGGCAIESAIPPEPDTVLPLRIHPSSQSPPIEVELAEVSWVSGRDFGVRFVQVEPSQAERLQRLLGTLQQENHPPGTA
jgi:hypothetical protein